MTVELSREFLNVPLFRELPMRTRAVVALVLFLACFYCAYLYGMGFSAQMSAPFWFPDTVLLTAVLLTPWRYAWLLLIATLPIRLFVAVPTDAPLWFLLTAFANDSIKALASAWCIRRFVPDLSKLGRLRESGFYALFAVVLVPAASALVGAGCRHLLGHDFWPAWLQWFMGDALANLLLTSAVLHWWNFLRRLPLPVAPRQVTEGTLLFLGVAVTSWFALGAQRGSEVNATALVYAPMPFLLWAAVRFGQRGAASMLFIVACFAIWSTAHGHGIFVTKSIPESVLGVQLFLFVVGVPVLALAALSEERLHFAEELRLSEERYRDVVESQTELVCRYKVDTTLTFANEAYCRFFGKRREDLIGRRFLTLIPEESHPAVLMAVREMVEAKQRITQEHQVLRPDGSIGWMQWDDYPIFSEQGELQELQGIGRDITDRWRVQEALRQSEEKFAGAFHASPNAISINRVKDDTFVDVNERWEALFKISHEDAIGRTATELGIRTSREDHERIRLAIEGRIALRNQELQLHRADGTPCWVSVSYELINLGGEPCYLGIIQDITERKRVEEAWRNVAHSSRLALIGELTASIAHEINQPLGAILSNAEAAEMMLNQPTPPLDQVRVILGDIRRDDLRASEVIRGVRALVSKRKPESQPLDLQAIVGEVLSLVRPDALRRGVKLMSEIAETPPGLLGDRIQIEQVLLNLVLNGMDAMSATPVGNRLLRIRSSNEGVRGVEVSVSDTGHGIPPDRLPRIFESFFTTKEHGMGLGLAMVRSIVELHRGHLTAENNPEGGATFRFSLPVDRVSGGSPKL